MYKRQEEIFSTITQSLKDVSGIYHVKTAYDAKKLHLKLHFQFNRIESLNEAIGKIHIHIDHPGVTHFELDHHSFTRTDTLNMAQLLTRYCQKNNIQMDHWLLKLVLKTTNYHTAYSFDKKITRATHTPVSYTHLTLPTTPYV